MHKYTSDIFESLYLCLHQHGQQNPVQVICIYVSLKCTLESLKANIDNCMKNVDIICTKCIIIGDFNMKSVTGNATHYNRTIEDYMTSTYNMKQYVMHSTTDNRYNNRFVFLPISQIYTVQIHGITGQTTKLFQLLSCKIKTGI